MVSIQYVLCILSDISNMSTIWSITEKSRSNFDIDDKIRVAK